MKKDKDNKVEEEVKEDIKDKTVNYEHEWGQGSKFLNPKYRNLQPYVPGEQLPEGKEKQDDISEKIRCTKEGIQKDIDKLIGEIDYFDFLSLNMDKETVQFFKEAYAEMVIYTKKLTNSLSKIQCVAEDWGGQKIKW